MIHTVTPGKRRTRTSSALSRTPNRLLAALPPEERQILEPHLEPLDAELRYLLYDVDQPIEYVYFPEGMIGSIVGVMADGTAVETATVGSEGIVGLTVFHGGDRTSAQAFCQVPGPTLRVSAAAFREAIGRMPTLTRLLNNYTQALFTLVAQNSACNRVHSMIERCARWLLLTCDRVERDHFPLTHQVLSQMLGVRRATVTEAMGAIQARGAVTYEMGRVTIVDHKLLESISCECYAVITREFDRLLGTAHGPSVYAGVKTAEGDESLVGDGAPRRSAHEEGA